MIKRMRPSEVPENLVNLALKAWREEPSLQIPKIWMRNVLSEVLTAYDRMKGAEAKLMDPQSADNFKVIDEKLGEVLDRLSNFEKIVIAHLENHRTIVRDGVEEDKGA